MNKKKIILLMTSASMAIGGLFSLVLLNQENNYSKTSADGSATFMMTNFSSPTEIDENTLEYQMPKVGSDSISVPIRVVGAQVSGNRVGGSSDFYFYNTEPFRGMSATGVSYNSASSYFVVSYLSYNPLNLADIYAGKYQDLYCSIVDTYGNNDYSIDSSVFPELVNYRYFLTHIIPASQESSVFLSLLGVVTPCAEEPTSVSVGTNAGVLSSDIKTYLDNTSNHSTTIPNQVGNGAYYAEVGSYFRFYNVTSHGGTNQFLANLTSGFNLTYEADMYGMHQELYQKKVGDVTHTFSVEVASGAYGDMNEISYTDTIGYIDRSTSWPTSSINAVISSNYNGLIIPFTSSLIKDYVTTASSSYGYDNAVMIMANLTEGHTIADLRSDLITLRQSYVSAGFTLTNSEDNSNYISFTLSYDSQIFGVNIGGQLTENVLQFMFGEYELKAFPTRSDIATKLQMTKSTDKIVLFEGAGDFSWGNESGGGAVPYGATTMSIRGYHIASADMNTFFTSLETAGYTLYREESGTRGDITYIQKAYKYELGDIYGSSLVVSVTLSSNGQASFSYTLYDNEKLLSEEVEFEYMMNRLNCQNDSPFITEAVLPSEYTCKYLEVYSTSYMVKGFVYGAGTEFVNSLTGITGLIYDYITDSYRVSGNSTALRIEQFEGGVVLTAITAQHFQYPFVAYTSFNNMVSQFVSDNGFNTDNIISVAATDNVPDYFWIQGSDTATYYGSEAKVDELKTLLTNQLESKTIFRYSSYLDAYVNESGVTYSFSKEKASYSDSVYILTIRLAAGATYVDYQSYNELSLGSNELLSHYPDFIPDKDLKAFHIEGMAPEYVKLATNQSGIVDYGLVLKANGFTFVEGPDYYMNVDSSTGAAYIATIAKNEESNNKWELTFTIAGYFYDASYLAEVGHEDMNAYFAQFGVQSNFTSTSKIYSYSHSGTYGQLTVFNNPAEIANYKSFLTSNGYTYNENINYYVRMSEDGSTAYGIAFMETGSLVAIQFVVDQMAFVSHSDMMTTLQASSSYVRNSAHLVYPTDDGYNHFLVESDSGRNTTIKLNIKYSLSAYETAIMAHEEYLTKESGKMSGNDYTRYILSNGTITVTSISDIYYEVELYCSYVSQEGRTILTALTANLGDNNVELDGTYRYYKFTAPEDGDYSFTTYSDDGYDTVGTLYDSDGINLYYDDDSGKGNNFLIKCSLLEDQVVYIAVKMFSDNEVDMTLSITLKTMPDPATIPTLTRGNNSITLSTEETYFAYTPIYSGYYCFDFAGDEPLDIVLYDENFVEISSTQETLYFEEQLLSGNKYYIGIKIFEKYSGSDLTYSFDFDCPSVPSDTTTSAILGYNSFTISDDTTWFNFTPSVSGYYKITSEGDSDSYDTYGYLYNSISGELYNDDDSGVDNQFSIELYLEAGVTYYIGAKLFGSSGETYSYFLIISQVS